MAAPATPANLSIDVVASNCLKLSWDNVAGEDGFYLYRSTDDGVSDPYAKVATLDADVLVYWDREVAPATQYYYKVSAYNGDGESSLSSSVNDTTSTQSFQNYWVGSGGPFSYDENAIYGEENVNIVGFRTLGRLIGEAIPVAANDVLRKGDVGAGAIAAPVNASYIVVALSGDLDAERRLQGTSKQIILTDGGANGDLTLSTPQSIDTDSNVTFNNVEVDGNLNHDGSNVGFFGSAPTTQQAHIADASTSHDITDPADTPADADALRDDLVANAIPEIESALDALGTKLNSVISIHQILFSSRQFLIHPYEYVYPTFCLLFVVESKPHSDFPKSDLPTSQRNVL